MSRTQFQRLALVTIVVLLATIASNRLMAYASQTSSARHVAVLAPLDPTVSADAHREACRVRIHAREVAIEHRRIALEHRRVAEEARRMGAEARAVGAEARAMARALQREIHNEVRVEVR